MMICHRKVKRRKHAASGDGADCFVKAKQWEAVVSGGCVYTTIILAHAPKVILFLQNHDVTTLQRL